MSDATLAPSEPSSLRLIATLGGAGLLAGLIIVGSYLATLPTIEANKAEALRAAVLEVVPGATQMQKLIPSDAGLVPAPEGDKSAGVYAAYDAEGAFKGYAIPAEGSGFQDTIKLIYGYDPQREHIVGLAILQSKETPGLGDKIFKDPDFVAEFDDLAVRPEVVPMKHGEATAPNHVDCITGATISSKSVVKIVNQGNTTWLGELPAPGSEPPLQSGGE